MAETDLQLAQAALAGSAAAVTEVHQLIGAACHGALRRAPVYVRDEVVQRIAVRLLAPLDGTAPRLKQFRGEASLERWLRVIAVREHLALLRERGQLASQPHAAEALPDRAFEIAVPTELGAHFKSAFQAGFGSLSLHERVLLRQHFRDGLTISSMARLRGIHRNTMARELSQVRLRLRNAVLARLCDAAQLSAAALGEILTSKKLDVSLSRLFAEHQCARRSSRLAV